MIKAAFRDNVNFEILMNDMYLIHACRTLWPKIFIEKAVYGLSSKSLRFGALVI